MFNIRTILTKNINCKIYNHIQRCLIMSVKIQRPFLTQLIHENVLSDINCANAHLWNNVIYKRFYCQAANNIENNQTSINNMNDTQRLEKILSDPKHKKHFEILELEIDVMRHNNNKVPENINPKHWLSLLEMNKSQRKKLLKFLWTNEQVKKNLKEKKELKKIKYLEMKAKEESEEDTDDLKYSLWQNTLFRRLSRQTVNDFYNWKAIQAMMFEPKIVFDCSYEEYMTKREIHNCAKQLTFSFAYNREHFNPLHLYFCNLNKDGLLTQDLKKNIPTLLDDDFPMTITSQSYLDLFPKDQLTYLTPHCKIDLKEYDPDMIYIIGAMVDKHNPQPLSSAKAKKEGIRVAKLPLEKYLSWGSGSSKNLTVNQILQILLDLKKTGDWKEALLKHTPNRKFKEAREHMLKNKIARSFQKNFERDNISKEKILGNYTFFRRKIN